MTSPDPRPVLDRDRSCSLGDDLQAAVIVYADGSTWPWLVRPTAPPDAVDGCSCAGHAPHDQDGPLPAVYRIRIRAARFRCGARTVSGRPCRTPVAGPADRCHHHHPTKEGTR